MRRLLFLSLLLAPLPSSAIFAAPAPASESPEAIFRGSEAMDGLLGVHADKAGGRILVTLPAPGKGATRSERNSKRRIRGPRTDIFALT